MASPEYNGSLPAAFKNVVDWLSRMDMKVFHHKPVMALSTSPGRNGGATNLAQLEKLLPWWGAELTGIFSLPRFNETFNDGQLPAEFAEPLKAQVEAFEAAVMQSAAAG